MRAYGVKTYGSSCRCCRESFRKSVARNDNKRAVVDGFEDHEDFLADYYDDSAYWSECYGDSECSCSYCRTDDIESVGPLQVKLIDVVSIRSARK